MNNHLTHTGIRPWIRTIVREGTETDGSGEQPQSTPPKQDGTEAKEEPHGTAEAKETDLQEQLDKIKAEARKWENRAKENKKAAEELAKLKESQLTEQEKAAKHTKELEAKVAQYETEKQQGEWRAQVSKDTGVPAELLRGSTLEEIQAHADSLKQYLPNHDNDQEAETGPFAGYAPSVGITPGKHGSVPLSEQIAQAEKNNDRETAMVLKAMQLGQASTNKR
ncbi:hypothetical protein CRD60_00950 [Bifidobacterium aemilianum]|uniref:Helicase n=1 Tax=Bifidobacterium aemilianum TaxID=2493120 RepID=A0A366K9U1_9BIFI|nr:hypothetical protein [Bifidobacterium aemilianum]RBP98464.1 hypothetical protein CRD60_00950 [Bifidobacterium aemilianum]